MKVTIDFDNCIASGTCSAICPEVFDQNDDGVVLLLEEPPAELQAKIDDAIDSCPAACISRTD